MQNDQNKSSLGRPFLRFAVGVMIPFRAVKVVFIHPGLWPACLFPWLISGALGWFLITQAIALAGTWIASGVVLAGLSATGWIATLFQWLTIGASWILGGLLVVWLSALLSVPFADWLAELAEPYSTPPLPPATQLRGWWSRAHWRRLKLDLWKTVAGLILSAAGLLLSAIPFLGVIGPLVLALGFTLQFVSYPQTRREEGLGASLVFLLRHLPLSLGFGLVLLAGFAIPFFAAFLLPFAVVGGTLLYAEARR